MAERTEREVLNQLIAKHGPEPTTDEVAKMEGGGAASEAAEGSIVAKRFHRARSGKKFAARCARLAEYFNLEVTRVRVRFVFRPLSGSWRAPVRAAAPADAPSADTRRAGR